MSIIFHCDYFVKNYTKFGYNIRGCNLNCRASSLRAACGEAIYSWIFPDCFFVIFYFLTLFKNNYTDYYNIY